MNLRRLFHPVAAIALAALTGACAQQVGDIDRTDDNVLEKSMFDGQWYMASTVVDTNATAAMSMAGELTSLERVYFEFSEDMLLARRVHENIVNLDVEAENLIYDVEFDGSVAAAWGAQHFDVQRSYNPATGEESNTIVENASDRRWYEQENIRVNWTDNRISTGNNSGIASSIENGMYTQISLQPEESEDTLRIEYDENGDPYYFDFTARYLIEGDWWTCLEYVGIMPWGTDCGTEEVTVRTSFRRVDVNDVVNAHVPRRYDEYDMNLFGFFRTNRCFGDTRYGCTDYSQIDIANVHDIWNNDRYEDGTPRPYYERTPDPIAYYASWEFPIDIIDDSFRIAEEYSWAFRRAVAGAQGRSIDEIPRMFYFCLNPGSTDPAVPPEHLEAVGHSPEARRLLEEAYAASAEGYANGACENVGERKYLGDIRYNFMNWRNDPAAFYGGFGPSATDPITGEIIHGVANYNGGIYNRSAERILNYVRIIEGDLTAEEYGYGVPIQDYFDDLREQNDYDLYFGADVTPGDDKSIEDLNRMVEVRSAEVADLIAEREENLALLEELRQDEHLQRVLSLPIDEFRLKDGRQADPLARLRGTSIEQALMVPEFVDHMSAGNFAPDEEIRPDGDFRQLSEDEWMNVVSPVRVAQAATVDNRYQRFRERMAERNVILADELDSGLIGFAEDMYRYKAQLEQDFPELSDEEIAYEMWLEIRGRLYRGVQTHEVGHTVGLRHNFGGTSDALNYFPQYWALRQQTFDEDCDGDGYRTFDPLGYGLGEVAPALCDSDETPEEEAERSAQILARMNSGTLEDGHRLGTIRMFENSTVMEYPDDFVGRLGGLGLYDYAALAFGYTELVEVFDEAPHRLSVVSTWDSVSGDWEDTTFERHTQRVTDMRDVEEWRKRLPGGTSSDVVGDFERDYEWDYWHYSVLPIMFWNENAAVDLEEAGNARNPDQFDLTGLDGMSSMYDRRLVSASDCHGGNCEYCDTDGDCGGGMVCHRNPLDPRQSIGETRGFCAAPDQGAPLFTEDDVHVPYKFCSDYVRGSSSLCSWFDSGADELEVTTRLIEDYEGYYPISAFRRGRSGFGLDLWPYISSLINYTFTPAIAQYQFWLLNAANRGPEWYVAERGGLSQYYAMEEALNFVSGVWTTPHPGTYVPDPEEGERYINVDDDMGYRYESFNPRFGAVPESDYIDLGVSDGARYGYSQYVRRELDRERPYYFFFQYEVLSHFWAKYAALISFMDGSVDVIGADTSSDNTAFYIPPYLAWPDRVGNFMGAIIAEDWGNFGHCVTEGPSGELELEPIDMIRSTSYSCGGRVLNPYTGAYSNRDYNMQLYSIVWSAANFSASLDYSWLDHSSVYVWGRGETPQFIEDDGEEDFEWVTYTDERGTTYAARYLATIPDPDVDPADVPDGDPHPRLAIDPDDYTSDYGPNVGYRMVQRAIDLETAMHQAEELEREAENNPAVFPPERDSTEIYFELQNHLEMLRFLVETNKEFQW